MLIALFIQNQQQNVMFLSYDFPNHATADIHLGEVNIERSVYDIAVQMCLRRIKFGLYSLYLDTDEHKIARDFQ